MKKPVTIFTYGEKYSWDNVFSVQHCVGFKPETSTDRIIVLLSEQEVELEMPDGIDSDFSKYEVEELEKMRDKIKADTVVSVKAIEDKIQSLLAIEDKTGE